GIVGGAEDALVNLAVPLLDLVLLVLQELLELAHVAPDGLREVAELVGQELGIGEPHHGGADRLGEGAAVHERRIVERRVPLEVVVDGVVDAAPAFAAVAEVERGDPSVLEERREIRARAQGGDARRGVPPRRRSVPNARASSSSGAWPESGSWAPFTHASWWLPRMIHASGSAEPGMRAITSYSVFVPQSDFTRRCTFAGPGPTW